jgi:hypothetical protein
METTIMCSGILKKLIHSFTLAVALFAFGLFGAPAPAWAGHNPNLIQQPGFEDPPTPLVSPGPPDDSAWTIVGAPGDYTLVNHQVYGSLYAAELTTGSGPAVTLSQTIPTVPGDMYVYSFHVLCDGGFPNSFNVSVGPNGGPLSAIYSKQDVPVQFYKTYTTGEIATSTSTTVQFGFINDGGVFHFDGASASLAPESDGTVLFLAGLLPIGLVALLARRRPTRG